MGRLTVRAPDRAEAAATADLARRHTERWSDSPAGWLSEEFVQSAYDMPGADPANDFCSLDLDGRFVGGYAVLPQPPYSEINVYTFIDPQLPADDARLVGEALIRGAQRAAQLYADRAESTVQSQLAFAIWPSDPFKGLAEEAGFGYVRSNFVMRRALADTEPVGSIPDGVTLRPIDVDADAADVTRVMTAFEDHHGDQVFSEEQLRHFMTGVGARPDLSGIAFDEQGPVAAVLCSVGPDGGHIDILATLRRARGRGIATGLLHTAFRSLAEAGCSIVRLNVDAENTTGALGIYEGAGMARESELEYWMRPIAARRSPPGGP